MNNLSIKATIKKQLKSMITLIVVSYVKNFILSIYSNSI